MSTNLFKIDEHLVQCQHIREYSQATANEQEDTLYLAVKQYTPLENVTPKPGDITIIGGHANGFPKELYEPLWDEILSRAKSHNFRIRSIWIADSSVQGQSGVLNEQKLGNDPSWNDHARDLLHLINVKRDQMPRPIIGIGHSMGGNNLVNLALIHPRLLTTLVLLDPVIQTESTTNSHDGRGPARLSTFRRDTWPSRAAAAESYKKSKFYQRWDPRVLDKWIQYGLRDMPTAKHSESTSSTTPKVTLTTTKHQEVFTFSRPNYEGSGHNQIPVNRKTHPDVDPSLDVYPFYRPEPASTLSRLPAVRPSLLYIWGGTSEMSNPANRKKQLDTSGVGVSGSGGAIEGRVKGIVLENIGHLVAMEAVTECADAAADWIGNEMQRWRHDEDEFRKSWSKKSLLEKSTVDEKWKQMVGGPLRNSDALGKPKL